MQRFEDYLASKPINKRSVTVLEIGAGPVQPLARQMAHRFYMNDKYRSALIRINPVKERLSQYKNEAGEIEKVIKSKMKISVNKENGQI